MSNFVAAFQYLESILGAPADHRMVRGISIAFNLADSRIVKLLASFFLSYPLAGLLKRIPDAKPYQKNYFIIAYAQKRGGHGTSADCS